MRPRDPSEEPQSVVATVARADWAHDRLVEHDTNGKADIDRWLRAAPSSAYEVPEGKRVISPIEHAHFPGWESAPAQFRGDLVDEGRATFLLEMARWNEGCPGDP
jgi:hypothetical protein